MPFSKPVEKQKAIRQIFSQFLSSQTLIDEICKLTDINRADMQTLGTASKNFTYMQECLFTGVGKEEHNKRKTLLFTPFKISPFTPFKIQFVNERRFTPGINSQCPVFHHQQLNSITFNVFGKDFRKGIAVLSQRGIYKQYKKLQTGLIIRIAEVLQFWLKFVGLVKAIQDDRVAKREDRQSWISFLAIIQPRVKLIIFRITNSLLVLPGLKAKG